MLNRIITVSAPAQAVAVVGVQRDWMVPSEVAGRCEWGRMSAGGGHVKDGHWTG